MAMDRRSTVRMNKERLKAALDSGFDEASGEAAKDGDGNWTTISEELGQIQEVADDLDTYDLNMNVGGEVAMAISQGIEDLDIAGEMEDPALWAGIGDTLKELFPIEEGLGGDELKAAVEKQAETMRMVLEYIKPNIVVELPTSTRS